jgi:hypothetical protein
MLDVQSYRKENPEGFNKQLFSLFQNNAKLMILVKKQEWSCALTKHQGNLIFKADY